MSELIESYNEQTKIIAGLKTAIKNMKGDKVSNMARQMAHLASALTSATVNLDIVDQQAQLIDMQDKSITKLTPLLRHVNEDITWNKKAEVADESVQSTETCTCLPRSLDSIWPKPSTVEYDCGDQSDRFFRLPCKGGVCKLPDFPSCTGSLDAKWERFSKFAGVVSSPNYPRGYGNNYRGTQTISVPPGMKVEIEFTAFYTENYHDHLTIRDGDGTTLMPATSGPNNDKVKGLVMKSRTNIVHFDFVSDGSTSYSGWSAKWLASPREVLFYRND